MGVEPKIEGKPPKMDGLFHGKPELKMDELRGFSHIFGNTHVSSWKCINFFLFKEWNLKMMLCTFFQRPIFR